MATTTRIAVSQILRSKDEGAEDVQEEEPKKKSREDWRKAKELEEARKAGTAPAAVDEEGKDINPHIPQYISSAPWYYGTAGPTLKHQRPQEEKQLQFSHLDEYYKKGVDASSVANKYRKGACENCGAMTHKKKDCLERPRKVGAKFTNTKIAPDEFVQPKLSLGFDGKRDRWNGYDPSEHKAIIEEYQKIEEAKRTMRAEQLEKDPSAVEEKEEDDDAEEDEDKYVDGVDMPGTKVDSKQRITVRNLRIREDTAKYLRNLDPNSAYYDPKTRSMRDNPNPKEAETDYVGENFVRFTGDTQKHAVAQLFAWEAHEKGVDVHLLAEPTKLEILQKEYEKKKEQFKSQVKDSILEKYGGVEHLKVPPKALLLAQTETFHQYNRDGTLIQGQEKQVARSKYEEDVLINNHTSVWGSFWKAGRWGYKCCHSNIKISYCIGEAGKSMVLDIEPNSSEHLNILKENSDDDNDDDDEDDGEVRNKSNAKSSSSDSEDTRSKTEKSSTRKKKKKKDKKKQKKDKKDSDELDKEKLSKAIRREEYLNKNSDSIIKMDDRKRSYNSMKEVRKPTEEEIEAYYLKRRRDEDPMNQFDL